MNAKKSSFTFVGYDSDVSSGMFRFFYELRTETGFYKFEEKLELFSGVLQKVQSRDAFFEPILQSLLLMLGISYWKIFCPQEIIVKPFSLTKEQADFWNLIYTKGLGEFFYKNTIDYRGLVQFPHGNSTVPHTPSKSQSAGSLVLWGGGKDSIVSAELLKKQAKKFSLFALNPVPIQDAAAKVCEVPMLAVTRQIDPQLFVLNKLPDVYNGHVPISAIYAFIGVLTAALYGYGYVIASNERSANYGNVFYLDEEINHQWSKSFEFEKALQSYLSTYVTRNITYFSLLRPIYEIQIVKHFVHYPKYFSLFTSCNTNFRLMRDHLMSAWCGVCPKCAFVFLVLAAFLPKETVTHIFGKNLFSDVTLFTTYEELLGIKNFKPFECVGTPKESLVALDLVIEKKEYSNDFIITKLAPFVKKNQAKIASMRREVYSISKNHTVPNVFHDVFKDL